MALALSLLLLTLTRAVQGQWSCSAGYKDKTGSPTCAGANSASCSDTSCCVATETATTATKTCATYAAAWVISQALGQGCKADKKFFDLKKSSAVVGGEQGDADIKAACCTSFADAKCGDWTNTCPSGKSKDATADAPGTDAGTITSADFQAKCCKGAATCADYSVAWATAQALGQGCKADKKFFDLKKSSAVVGGAQGDADIKAACCTPFADAKCGDWVLQACKSGKFNKGTGDAPGTDAGTITNTDFNDKCCVDPLKCADYSEDASGAIGLRGFPILLASACVVLSGLNN